MLNLHVFKTYDIAFYFSDLVNIINKRSKLRILYICSEMV